MRLKPKSFTEFAWAIVIFTLFVIIWGGFVSASGSGDGCGSNWPLCQQLVDQEVRSIETFVEFFHRATSGLALLGVIALIVGAFRHYPKAHRVRRGAIYSGVFMITESLLGAALVLFQWVDTNESLARAFVQPIHLVNTFLLMGSLGLTAWWASGHDVPRFSSENRRALRLLIFGLVGIVLVSSFGTIASLASTIFPSESFFDGVQKDFARDVHYLIRLRVWHPILAVGVGMYLQWVGNRLDRMYQHPRVHQLSGMILTIYWIQFGMGLLNAILLTPIWLQLLHLLGAHLIWLTMVLLGATVLSKTAVSQPQIVTT